MLAILRSWCGELLPYSRSTPGSEPELASVLFEDYCRRRQQLQQTTPDQSDRLPNILADLREHPDFVFSRNGPSAGTGVSRILPRSGDEVLGFRLLEELGCGSFAKVFQAQQIGLAGRPVVVKVSAIDGNEPLTMAQLQHTNIMPIYSVHEDVRAGLRIVCMPYCGGASLSRILQLVWSGHKPPALGAELVEALAKCAPKGEARTSLAGHHVPLAYLASTSYVRAAVWIVARLAEALQHAHARGILHHDVKPSNVLLGADGQPMLLDFNLAQSLADSDHERVATLGGTVAYMAPEHLRALAGRRPALVRQVDHRADIYGLGMLFYEMLTGRRAFDQSGSYSPLPALIEAMALERARTTPSLRRWRPDLPWSLERIIRKCLAPDANDRYEQAEHLAEDLRRYLEDRPHAFERSWPERLRKWIRRHPCVTTASALITSALLLLGCDRKTSHRPHLDFDAAINRHDEPVAVHGRAERVPASFLTVFERHAGTLARPTDMLCFGRSITPLRQMATRVENTLAGARSRPAHARET